MMSTAPGLPSRLAVLQRQASGSGAGGEEVEQPAPKTARLAAPRGLLGPQGPCGQQQQAEGQGAAHPVGVKQETDASNNAQLAAEPCPQLVPEQPAQPQGQQQQLQAAMQQGAAAAMSQEAEAGPAPLAAEPPLPLPPAEAQQQQQRRRDQHTLQQQPALVQQDEPAPHQAAVTQQQEEQQGPAGQRPAKRRPGQQPRRRQQQEAEEDNEPAAADDEEQPRRKRRRRGVAVNRGAAAEGEQQQEEQQEQTGQEQASRYIGVRWRSGEGAYLLTVADVRSPQGELEVWDFCFPDAERAARCYDQAEIWKALRSGTPLGGLRLNHPLNEYESQPDLLARLAGLDYQAAWDWLVREHNAARGQRQMSDFLRGAGGEGGRRRAGHVVAGGSSRPALPPATAASASTAARARGAPGVFYERRGQQPGALPFLLRVPPPSGGASGSLRAHSQEWGKEMGRFFAKRDAQAAYDLCLCRQVALDEATEEQAREALLLPDTSSAWLADEQVMEHLGQMTGDAAMQRNLVGKDGHPTGLLKQLLSPPKRPSKRRRTTGAAARSGSRAGELVAAEGAAAQAAGEEGAATPQQQVHLDAQLGKQPEQQHVQQASPPQQAPQQAQQAQQDAGEPVGSRRPAATASEGAAPAEGAALPAAAAAPEAAPNATAAAAAAGRGTEPTAAVVAAAAAVPPAPSSAAAAAPPVAHSEPPTLQHLNRVLDWCLAAGGLAADEDRYRFFFFRVLLPAERSTDYAAIRAYQQRGDARAAAFCVRQALAAAEAQELGGM